MNDYFYKTKNTEKDKLRGTATFNKYYKFTRSMVEQITKGKEKDEEK